jgi:Na+/melibiose symporter-like transporter
MGYILPTKAELEKAELESKGTPHTNNIYLLVLIWPMFLSCMRLFILVYLFNFDTPQEYLRRNQKGLADRVLRKTQNNYHSRTSIDQLVMTKSLSIRNLISHKYWRQLVLGMFYAALQPLSGVNAVIFYCQKLFLELSNKYSNLMILMVGVILVVSALVCGRMVDSFGRKKVTLIGLLMCTLSLGGLALREELGMKWMVVPLIYIFTLGYGLSLGPVFSIYISEILPLEGVWLVVLVNWFVSIFVGLFFFKLDHLYGP